MVESIPLGKKEDLRLELKARAALDAPEDVAREVVAMLNAEGGEVWVGLREEGGRAVAVDPIPDPEPQAIQLRGFLVDKIEPSPTSREVDLRREDTADGALFRIEVRPQEDRRPYAFLKNGGGRHYLIRIGERLRPMTREEIRSSFRGVPQREEPAAQAAERLLEIRREALASGESLFWLGILPAEELELDLRDPSLEDYLRRPELTGNRISGWGFTQAAHRPLLRKEKLATHPEEGRSVEIWKDGTLLFQAPLESMHWKGEPDEIWPYILLEYPVSAFRLARKIYEGQLGPDSILLADMALIGVEGWKLRPHSPGRWGSRPAISEEEDLLWGRPLVFRFEEVERDDRCAVRLVERVYEAFGFRRDAIPKEFDRKTGRLVLPE